MAAAYVPQPVYPKNLDSDYTLYKVTNTAETTLSADLEAWAETIYVNPVLENQEEIWPNNGYVTISGELIYYSATGKNVTTGKVTSLTNCIRNIDGSSPQFNKVLTPVRQFVISQHHNQLARAVVNLENFIGFQNTTVKDTLDWKIRYLNSITSLGDDANCPQISFYYTIASEDPIVGTTINYNLEITGVFDSFILDFGDGSITQTDVVGTHSYPPNIKINPTVSVTAQNCDCVQTSAAGAVGGETAEVTQTTLRGKQFTTIPDIPEFPDINLNEIGIPPRNLQLPPIVFPAIDAKFGPIEVPSTIEIMSPTGIPSTIRFGDLPQIPTFISVIQAGTIPSFISIQPTELNLLNTDYCVNCTTATISASTDSGTVKGETLGGCKPCVNINDGDSADGNEIEKVQIVVHDFFVQTPGEIARWDAVKLLVEDPKGNTCLILGSGPETYDEATIPRYQMNAPITLVFDDKANGSFYNFNKVLVGGTYKPSPNGNWETNYAGLAVLSSPAPNAPYGGSINQFTDKKVSKGKWKAYVVVGSGPQSQCSGCLWEARIIGMTESLNPSFFYDWKLVSDCGPDCGCPRPTIRATKDATARTNCTGDVPPPEYVIPNTSVTISKICIRVFYRTDNPPCASPTPTPTGGPPFAFTPLATPMYTGNKLNKKQKLIQEFETYGKKPTEIIKEISLPFQVTSIEEIPTDLNNDMSRKIHISESHENVQRIQSEHGSFLVVNKNHDVNIDVEKLFGEDKKGEVK